MLSGPARKFASLSAISVAPRDLEPAIAFLERVGIPVAGLEAHREVVRRASGGCGQLLGEGVLQRAPQQEPGLPEPVPGVQDHRLADQRLCEDVRQVERFGKLERQLESRDGGFVLVVEDEKSAELCCHRGDVDARVRAGQRFQRLLEPGDGPRRMSVAIVELGQGGTHERGRTVESLSLEHR